MKTFILSHLFLKYIRLNNWLYNGYILSLLQHVAVKAVDTISLGPGRCFPSDMLFCSEGEQRSSLLNVCSELCIV